MCVCVWLQQLARLLSMPIRSLPTSNWDSPNDCAAAAAAAAPASDRSHSAQWPR